MQIVIDLIITILALIGASLIWLIIAGIRDHYRCERYRLQLKLMNQKGEEEK